MSRFGLSWALFLFFPFVFFFLSLTGGELNFLNFQKTHGLVKKSFSRMKHLYLDDTTTRTTSTIDSATLLAQATTQARFGALIQSHLGDQITLVRPWQDTHGTPALLRRKAEDGSTTKKEALTKTSNEPLNTVQQTRGLKDCDAAIRRDPEDVHQ